jgi:hypothetical protein
MASSHIHSACGHLHWKRICYWLSVGQTSEKIIKKVLKNTEKVLKKKCWNLCYKHMRFSADLSLKVAPFSMLNCASNHAFIQHFFHLLFIAFITHYSLFFSLIVHCFFHAFFMGFFMHYLWGFSLIIHRFFYFFFYLFLGIFWYII